MRFYRWGAILFFGLAACGADAPPTVDGGADAGVSDARTDAGTLDAGHDGGFEIPPKKLCADVVCELSCAIYVDRAAAPGGSGTLADPYDTIQPAIASARDRAGDCCTCEVRVAEGTYTIFENGPDDSVAMLPGVHLLGGYATGFGERDRVTHETILDGHFEGLNDEPPGWVYHVVTGSDRSILDGFTITGGIAREDEVNTNPNNYGGGLYIESGTSTVSNCRFTDNIAGYGGAIHNVAAKTTLRDVAFDNNRATWGGAISNYHAQLDISGGRFTNNGANRGAGVFDVAGAFVCTDCVFEDGFASETGGAIQGNAASIIRLERTTTSSNAANMRGGGIYLGGKATLTVNDSTFITNRAEEGGGLFAASTASVSIEGSVFVEHSGATRGSGLMIEDAYLSANDTRFVDNAATSGAGAYLRRGAATFDDCTFENNVANDGGGVFDEHTNAVFRDCAFHVNRSINFGAGFYGSTNNASRFERCLFVRNNAWRGGAMFLHRGADATILDTTFRENRSSDSAAAILVWGDPSGTHSVKLENCVVEDNDGGRANGGAMDLDYADIIDCSFKRNRGGNGGSIQLGSGTVRGSEFIDNVAWASAGGGYFERVVIEDSLFSGNTCGTLGSGLRLGADGKLINSVVTGNGPGWAVFINDGKGVQVRGTIIEGNADHGVSVGHLYNYAPPGVFTMSNTTIFGHPGVALQVWVQSWIPSDSIVANSILWGNGSTIDAIENGVVRVVASDIEGGLPNNAMISDLGQNLDVDPMFVDQDNGDVHLAPTSPVINQGNDAFVGGLEVDIDGEARIADGRVDMGADEVQP